MTAKTARHRSAERTPAEDRPVRPSARPVVQPQHRGGLPPALGTGLLAAAVVVALGIVVLGVLR